MKLKSTAELTERKSKTQTNPVPSSSTEELTGIKDSHGKAPMHLCLWKPVRWLIRIRQYGLKKYTDPFNYKKIDKLTWYDACLRHLSKWQDGEQFDSESGLPHLAHALCNLIYLVDMCEDEPKFE